MTATEPDLNALDLAWAPPLERAALIAAALRQAKADALEEFAHHHVGNQSPGRMAEDLLEHAAAIRAGRQ